MKSKKELRHTYRAKRCQLSIAREAVLNSMLLNQFMKIDLSKVSLLHVFIPIEKYHEPNTYAIINYLQEFYPQIKIVVSRSNVEDYSMRHYLFDTQMRFEKNAWGISEPTAGVEVAPSDIDMVLVPLLIFDLFGYRVGYGKGFYDRFFSQCKVDVQRIGLSFFEPIDVIMDRNEHDVQLTQAVTPYHIYHFVNE